MKKYFLTLFTFLLLTNLSAQEFEVSPLITIPGDNTNFSVNSTDVWDFNSLNSYICWENKNDSLYTICLKQLDDASDSIYIVYSDTIPNVNPTISYYNKGIRIVWQSVKNNHWVICSRDFTNDISGDVNILTDTTVNSISPAINKTSAVWIQDDRLLCCDFSNAPKTVDSIYCSNPKLISYSTSPVILYEKGNEPNTQIYLADYVGASGWNLIRISDSGYNINPSFGSCYNIAYQTKEKNNWKIIYSFFDYSFGSFIRTNNTSCNYEHPIAFSYPLPTYKRATAQNLSSYFDGFFAVYDSDSLADNKEIFIDYKPLYLYGYSVDTTINISNLPGDDIKPQVAILKPAATPMVGKLCIFWEHMENNKTDIWWATTTFKFPTDVEEENSNQIDFSLSQNYPNPFNPSTKIKYTIPALTLFLSPRERMFEGQVRVILKVYDILGNEVVTLVNEEQPAGEYEVEIDGGNLSSGIYFYTLNIGNQRLSRRMCLVK